MPGNSLPAAWALLRMYLVPSAQQSLADACLSEMKYLNFYNIFKSMSKHKYSISKIVQMRIDAAKLERARTECYDTIKYTCPHCLARYRLTTEKAKIKCRNCGEFFYRDGAAEPMWPSEDVDI
jgi:protein-arginine kinase activator protein McsA